MKNWSVAEEKLKRYPEKYEIWRLEQLVNYGLDGERLSRKKLKKYWKKLHLDPKKRKFLKLLLQST